MKRIFIIIIFFLTFTGFAQEVQNDSIYKLSEVEKKPEFGGGIDNFYKFVGSKFRVPQKRKFKGKVIVEFIVERDGTLSNIQIVQDPGYGCGDEAIRVLKMSPVWKPGEKKGKLIRTLFNFPITIENAD